MLVAEQKIVMGGEVAPLFLLTAAADLLIRMSTGAIPERPSVTVRDHRITVRDAPE
jgi:hypothetical protein